MTKRILITIEYDGGPFVGWQRQDNGDSVQAAIEEAAAAFIGTPTAVTGAGRTDSGVHDPIGIKLVWHIQMRNLTGGMHTRIGTPGPGNCRRDTNKGCGGFFYGRLN